MDKWYFWIGILAAICIAIFNMPQLIKVIKTKNTCGMSTLMLSILTVGDIFFVLDGIGMLADQSMDAAQRVSTGLPIFLANAIAVSITIILLVMKIRSVHYAKKFKTTEKDFCENYEAYKTKMKIAKAEAAKAKEVVINEPKDSSIPKNEAGPVNNGDTAQVIE